MKLINTVEEMYDKHLNVFLTVADAGSFSKAAKKLKITPQAVLKQIQLLEEKLGVKLFIRTSSGIVLTGGVNQFLMMQTI